MKSRIVLTKVTLQYSQVEDRIRMTGRVGESEAMVFWLTQRICLLLVRAIGNFIERSTEFPAGSDRELVLSFKQSVAMVHKEPSDPVVADAEARASLIERIDVTLNPETIFLNFFIPGDGVAQLSLTVQAARQWLGILRTQFQQAEWSCDAWPAWMSGALDTSLTSGSSGRMH